MQSMVRRLLIPAAIMSAKRITFCVELPGTQTNVLNRVIDVDKVTVVHCYGVAKHTLFIVPVYVGRIHEIV